jgi:hypothetical protein
MKSQIVEYLMLKAATIGGVNTHLGIHELRTNGSGQTVPYAYVGGDDLQPLDIDNGSVGYFRTYQREEFAPVDGMRAERDLSGTFYIRYAAILHRDNRDHVAYAEDVANAFTGFNSDLKSILKAKRVNVTRSSIETDITRAWREEFSVPVTDLPYNLAMVFVDVTVTVVGSRDCWQGCSEQYDILQGFDWCNPATVARLTDAQRDCIRGFLPTPCEDATYTLEDTDGNTLSTGSIPSGGSEDIVAPDGTVLRDGQPYGSVLSGGTIDVPSAVTPCADATVEINGVEMATIPSGDTENIEVRQSTGSTLVGSQQGQYWRIGDSEISINGTPIQDVQAEDSLDIPVIQDGSPAGSWNGTQWVIPSCPAPSPPRNTAMAVKTGQTVSYGTGSDGDVQAGRGVDFFTLEENNPFGNTNRFTDINGGQVFNSGDIALDWLTYSVKTGQLLWILLDRTTVRNWGDCLAEAVARTDYGYNDWRLLNVNEAGNLMYWEVGQVNAFDYTPMSVANIGSGSWTGTTYPRDATRAAIITATTFSISGSQTKSTSQRGAICRTGNISELTIP